MIASVSEFLRIADEWQEKHLCCPRCGCADDVFYRSELSGVRLCDDCYITEDLPQYENYDNWAITIAVRAVCDTDIKVVRSVF